MANGEKPDSSPTKEVTTSADDFPNVARLLARQLFLQKWYKPVALAPFALMLFITLKFFPNANGVLFDILIFATLGWAIAVAGYAFYLMFGVKCPACDSRFGIGQSCRSCGLPRHSESTGPITLPNLV
jgi:hypothetical protein